MSLRLAIALILLSPIPIVRAATPDIKPVTVHLEMHPIEDTDTTSCSATVVGPYAVLTASHCETATDSIQLGGDDVGITERIRDGRGHTILLLSGLKEPFKIFAKPCEDANIEGTEVYIDGNPGNLVHILRRGMFSGWNVENVAMPVMLFDLHIYSGDSGAGVFRESGCLVATLNYGLQAGDDKWQFWLAGAYPYGFKKTDYKKALAYVQPMQALTGSTTGSSQILGLMPGSIHDDDTDVVALLKAHPPILNADGTITITLTPGALRTLTDKLDPVFCLPYSPPK